jgi:cobalt-zinc-cadmium efflux system membrane fusion protein
MNLVPFTIVAVYLASTASAPASATDRILTVNAAQRQSLGIRTTVAQPTGSVAIATLPATIALPPGARVAVSAPFPGVIRQNFTVSGQAVGRGEALATVFSREVLEMGAELSRARARQGLARSAAARTDQLVKEGIAAGARAEEARAALQEADTDVSSRSRLLALAHADAATGVYTLRAPIAGHISSATVQTGGAIDGMSAPFVVDASRRYAVEAQLPERLVGKVSVGDRIGLPGGISGIVTSVGVTIDPQTRSALLKASVPAAPGLVAGSSISVALYGSAVAGAVTVPASAVARVGGRTMVFTETASGFTLRPVKLVSAGGADAVVTGVTVGSRVASAGVSELKALGLATPAGN